MTLGERIKKARKSKGLRQEEFARILEIPVSTLANYENNHREPRVEMLIKIAEALNIPIGGLITIEPIEKIEKEIYLKAINTFGENQQIIKAIEELGELSTALARHFTKNESSANINEEIADVEIMLSQLRLIFSNAEIDHHKKEKLERLKGVVW
ncbi:MAG: hypothetical protein K0R54_2092 [Clostridiaceae bacterium]|jgi:transcriptional regulator with XRE-family HTH domain|nr:hypothetical protein [Clostridiaceae bacterium]